MYEIFSSISSLLSQPFMKLAYGFEGTPILAALFSGFGQILNGKLIKGFILVGLEILINVQANLIKPLF